MPRILRVYLDAPTLAEAQSGQHNFLNRVVRAIAPFGYRAAFLRHDLVEHVQGSGRRIWTLHHMTQAPGPNGMTFRRVYVGPFWQIDRLAERWNWHTARMEFRPEDIDPAVAQGFADRWRFRLYRQQVTNVSQDGFILCPLQGRLLEQRSFQSGSPLAMLKETLSLMPRRPVVATLHPKETYTTEELAALSKLAADNPRLTVSDTPTLDLLSACDAVVTQNSSVAFTGYFMRKPAILFARSDFHHIALSVPHIGLQSAFARLASHTPDYDRYLWWFLQHMSLNAGRDDVEDKIAATLRRCGMVLEQKGHPKVPPNNHQ